MATTLTLLDSSPLSAAWLKGRMIGALICGFFGAVWMYEALFFGRIATPLWLTTISILTAIFVAWPVIRLRSFPGTPRSASDRQRWAAIAVPYWTIVAIEWLLSAVAVNWLVHIHRYSLVPQALGVIVGLHFLPLARLFKSPLYYWTGAAMVLGSVASLAIHAGHLRNIAANGVDGLSLWATAAVILGQDLFSSRKGETQ
jgi:hypothetical protein